MGRILVTGGGGMVAANLVRRLIHDGHELTVASRSKDCPLRLHEVESQIRLVQLDLRNPDDVMRSLTDAQPDLVVHLASTPFNPPPTIEQHLQVNVGGTANLLKALADRPGLRIVHAGSAAQYGDGDNLHEDQPERPANWLGISKTCAATLLHSAGRLYGLETVELRLFTPFGPWEQPRRLIPHTIHCALKGEAVALGDGRPERDYVYIDDVVDAFALAITTPVPAGSVINIGSGIGRSVASVAGRTLELMDGPAGLKLGTRPTRSDEIWKASANIQRAADLLNWRPKVSFDDGLQRTIDWVRSHRTLLERLS